MNATEIDLQQFCAPDRPDLAEPFSDDRYTYASNGKFIVRIPFSSGGSNLHAQRAAKLFNEQARSGDLLPMPDLPPIKMQPCTECNGSGLGNRECPTCKGEGEVECGSCGKTSDCKTCGGEGIFGQTETSCPQCLGAKEEPKHTPVVIGKHRVQDLFLRKLAVLPDIKFIEHPTEPNEPLWFTFDGGDGLLMPLAR